MLEDRRIKEAEHNIRNYLAEQLLKKTNINENIKNIFINNSKESLKVANLLFKNNHSDLWTIVCSYYSMYYMANAVLYNLGYKVGHEISHKITADALIVLVRNKLKKSLIQDYEEAQTEALEIAGIKADELIKNFDQERAKRGRLQYRMTESIKHAKAKTSLERAKRFVFEMGKLI